MFKKILFLASFATTVFFYGAANQTQNVSNLPAITLQLSNNGVFKTKYAKLYTEVNYGLWLAFDNQTNKIHWRILQDTPEKADFFAVEEIEKRAKELLSTHKETLYKLLEEIVDFQEVKRRLSIIENDFYRPFCPTLGDVNTALFNLCNLPKISDKKIHATVKVHKSLFANNTKFSHTIKAWQQKYNISPENMREINNFYQTIQQHIAKDLNTVTSKDYTNEFSFSIDPVPCYTTQLSELEKPYVIHFAEFSETFSNMIDAQLNTQYKITANAFFYLPPANDQYADPANQKRISTKIKELCDQLKTNKAPLLKPNAPEKIKARVNDGLTLLIEEIKKIQQVLNTKIDHLCEILKKIF